MNHNCEICGDTVNNLFNHLIDHLVHAYNVSFETAKRIIES